MTPQRYAISHHEGTDIARAIGLSVEGLRQFSIISRAGAAVEVQAVYFAKTSGTEKAGDILKRFVVAERSTEVVEPAVDAEPAPVEIQDTPQVDLQIEIHRLREKDALQAHALKALELQLRDQGRDLEETRRLLREAQARLQFP